MARPILALAGIAVIGVGVAIGFGHWGFGFGKTVSRDATLSQPIRSVKLAGDSGDVRIRTGSGAARVHQTLRYHNSDEPADAFRIVGDQLVLGDCGRNCSADFDVVVPAGLPVTGASDSGSVDLAGVGSVDVSADSGSATVRDVSGPVKLRLDSGRAELHNVGDIQVRNQSGRITADGVRGPVDVNADSGRIDLILTQPSDVKAKAQSGRIELSVPSSGSYRVVGSSDSGRRTVDVPQHSDSDTKTLDLTTDSGGVNVKAA